MVTIKNETEFDKYVVSHIINPSKPNIKFHNITFDCETIEDASGNVFARNVRGEWIEPKRDGCVVWDKRAYAQCSICGYKQFFGREKNFCPNCGADMRGE